MVLEKKPVIETRNLSHVYEGGIVALKDISVKIEDGDFIGLIGQNGSGKTTFAKHLIGLLRPTNGSVLLDGTDISNMSVAHISHDIGFVFQNPDHQIFCPTVFEEILFGPKNQALPVNECNERVQDAIARFRLDPYVQFPPAVLGFGLRRKVSLAAVYAMKPRVLILDEPTVGLDRKSSMDLMEIVRELNDNGHTIIIITHDMRVIAEYTKTSFVLKSGELLAAGSTARILSEFEMLKTTQINPPQVIQLSHKLGLKIDERLPLTNPEFKTCYNYLSPEVAV